MILFSVQDSSCLPVQTTNTSTYILILGNRYMIFRDQIYLFWIVFRGANIRQEHFL